MQTRREKGSTREVRVAVVVVAVVVVAVAAVVVAVVVRQEEVENHPALLQRKNSDQQRSCLPLGFVLLTDCLYTNQRFRDVFAGYIVELAAMMLVIFLLSYRTGSLL